jgi:hypothetical protein
MVEKRKKLESYSSVSNQDREVLRAREALKHIENIRKKALQKEKKPKSSNVGNLRDRLLLAYSSDLREKFAIEPDHDLLKKITISLGASVYEDDGSGKVGLIDAEEIEQSLLKKNFETIALGTIDVDDMATRLRAIISKYQRTTPNCYRAVVYYVLYQSIQENAFVVDNSQT